LGIYLESDGSPKPYRVHWRTPSFVNLQVLPLLSKGHLVADLVALIGTIDIVLGDADR
jgi:NADH-quinone oxidoreductase subunit D